MLDYFGNPMEKLYDPVRGELFLPQGVDAGEILYLRLSYDTVARSWRADKKSHCIDACGYRPVIGISEGQLIAMAYRYQESSQ
jgi:hypothetical protein